MQHKILEEDGCDIHYYMKGDRSAEAVVFLHPAFSDHTCFYRQTDFFAKRYFVIEIDLLGHGRSKAGRSKDQIDQSIKHLSAILKQEGIDRAHFVGVSMGALLAQYMALQKPDQVLSLTAVGGYNINSDNKEVIAAQGKEKLKWLFKIIFSMDSFRRYVSSVSVINEEEKEHFYMSTQGFTRKSFRVMPGLQKITVKRETAKFSGPLLILCGENDTPLALKAAKSWHKEDSTASYFLIKQSGHCANLDNPDAFNKIVSDFLEILQGHCDC